MSALSYTICSGLVKILLDEMQLWEEWSDSVAVVVKNHLESFVCWRERKIQVGRKCGISVDHILRAFPVKILLFLCFYFYHLLCQKAIPQQCPHTFIASFSFFLLLLESSKYEKTWWIHVDELPGFWSPDARNCPFLYFALLEFLGELFGTRQVVCVCVSAFTSRKVEPSLWQWRKKGPDGSCGDGWDWFV